jgi:hypothetical protein
MAAVLGGLASIVHNFAIESHRVADAVFPPEERAALWKRLKAFAVANPKLSVRISSQSPLI